MSRNPKTLEAFTPAVASPDIFDLSFVAEGNEYREYRVGNARLSLDARGDKIIVSSLRVAQTKRRMGFARDAMQALIAQADKYSVRLELNASSLDKRTNQAKLVAFYQSLGFNPTGRRINPLGHPQMLREPAQEAAHRGTEGGDADICRQVARERLR